jgi:DNA end-binding protein Ku
VAIARVVLRSKEQLVAIRPSGDVLLMETMIFHDEVVPTDALDDLPDAASASERELAMAQQLIESLSSSFEPEKYRDEYRDKVLDLIERKAAGEEITVQPEAPQPKAVPDLMAALEASLAAVKAKAPAAAPADGDGDGGGKEEGGDDGAAPKKRRAAPRKPREKAAQ